MEVQFPYPFKFPVQQGTSKQGKGKREESVERADRCPAGRAGDGVTETVSRKPEKVVYAEKQGPAKEAR